MFGNHQIAIPCTTIPNHAIVGASLRDTWIYHDMIPTSVKNNNWLFLVQYHTYQHFFNDMGNIQIQHHVISYYCHTSHHVFLFIAFSHCLTTISQGLWIPISTIISVTSLAIYGTKIGLKKIESSYNSNSLQKKQLYHDDSVMIPRYQIYETTLCYNKYYKTLHVYVLIRVPKYQ